MAFQTIMAKIARMKIDEIITDEESRVMIQELLVEYSNLVNATLKQK